jgi:hypothetical protein
MVGEVHSSVVDVVLSGNIFCRRSDPTTFFEMMISNCVIMLSAFCELYDRSYHTPITYFLNDDIAIANRMNQVRRM